VELQLLTAGIRLVKKFEAAKLPGEPYLYLNQNYYGNVEKIRRNWTVWLESQS